MHTQHTHDRESPSQLTQAQLSQLRARLIEIRDSLRGNAATPSTFAAPEGRRADPADEAEASLAQHEALAMDSHARSQLFEVERALARMDAGTYGVSESSGEPIGYARLSVVPWARLTTVEQESEDRARR
jgi:DnaK suppressor protein